MFLVTTTLGSCGACGEKSIEAIREEKLTKFGKILVSTVIGDAFIFLTFLVVGILGALALIPGLSAAGSYALLAVSGAVALTWAILVACTRGSVLGEAKKLIAAAL